MWKRTTSICLKNNNNNIIIHSDLAQNIRIILWRACSLQQCVIRSIDLCYSPWTSTAIRLHHWSSIMTGEQSFQNKFVLRTTPLRSRSIIIVGIRMKRKALRTTIHIGYNILSYTHIYIRHTYKSHRD